MGKGGDASPLKIEVLSIADSNGANVPGTAYSGTFSTLAPATASTTTNTPTNAPVSTYTASDLLAVPTPVDKPAKKQTHQPPEKTLPAMPSEGATFHSVPGFNALLGLFWLATAYLLRRR